MERARGATAGLLVILFLAVLLAGGVPGATGVSITIPYSAASVADVDLDGNPGTGAWSDAGSWTIPLENGQASPYGSATLYAKHDDANVYFRVDGKIDVSWTSVATDHFWLGMQVSPSSTSHHGGGTWDGVFFGQSSIVPTESYPPVAVDTNGFSKPPAKDTAQNDFGQMAYSGAAVPYSLTAEWKRPLSTGDTQDLTFVADGTTAYNFFVTTDSDGGGSSGGAIDHSAITNLNTMRFQAPPVPVTHDVAVIGASASPTSVLPGQAVTISATVQNLGTAAETFDVKAYAGTIVLGPQTVTDLGAGATQSLTFNWDTTAVAAGSYLIKAEAVVASDANPADNLFTDGTVMVNAIVHDVAITAASASPLSGLVGTAVTITGTAANLGTQAETFDVKAYAGTILVGTQTVTSLASAGSVGLSFPWDTSGAMAGSYPIKVEAASVTGETSLANNVASDGTVVLSAIVHDVAATAGSASPLSGTVGMTVSISGTVQNQGTQAETFDVRAYAGTILVGAQTVTSLAPGASTVLSFSWSTAGVATGSYPIKVQADTVTGETDLADNVFTDGTVVLSSADVHDVAVESASPTPLSAPVGTTVTIAATVANQGTLAETFDVSAYAGAVLVGTQNVLSLAAGSSRALSFTWDTSAVAPGVYAIKVQATAVVGETDLADNVFTDGSVIVSAVVHDVAVTAASASPLSAIVGTSISISATVANQGTQAETFDVRAYAGTILVGTHTVTSLAAGTTQGLNFAWDTGAVAPGSYPIKLEAAALAGETDLADNVFNAGSVTLSAPVHDVAITAVSASPGSANVGATISVSVSVANQGTQTEAFTVTALANDLTIGSESVTLSAAATATLSFSWATSGLSAGNYTISATASTVSGETDLADNALVDGIVALNVPVPAVPTLKLGRIWPKWRRAPSGTALVMYAKVANLGASAAYAKVVYDIYERSTGAKVATVSSGVVLVPAGAVIDGVAFASTSWLGTTGVYMVVGTLVYGTSPVDLNLTDGTKSVSRVAVL